VDGQEGDGPLPLELFRRYIMIEGTDRVARQFIHTGCSSLTFILELNRELQEAGPFYVIDLDLGNKKRHKMRKWLPRHFSVSRGLR